MDVFFFFFFSFSPSLSILSRRFFRSYKYSGAEAAATAAAAAAAVQRASWVSHLPLFLLWPDGGGCMHFIVLFFSGLTCCS